MERVADLTVPGDKSISHRALILAALAEGESRVTGLLDSADVRSTAAVLRRLGVAVPADLGGEVRIAGRGLTGLTEPSAELDCGNSGTTARLLLGVLAGCPFTATLTGDASLRSRPMRRVTEPLGSVGADVREVERPDRLPIRIRGRRPLHPIRWHSERASAQVKSALLLAALTGGTTAQVTEPWLSRDHTERMLRQMGAGLRMEGGGREPGVSLEPVQRLDPLDLAVPGDVSSALYFVAVGLLAGGVRVRDVGLNPTRTGALDVLARMGARIAREQRSGAGAEPVGDLLARPGPLEGAVVRPEEVPALIDEVPLLAALAAVARGETRFDGVGELRVKESDRLSAMSDNLRALGVETEEGPEHLVVQGREGPLRGRVEARDDHRIAMAFGVLAAVPGNEIDIEGAEAVGISFPSFWEQLDALTRELGER